MSYADYISKLTPIKLTIAGGVVLALAVGASSIQSSCGKKHDQRAIAAGALADAHAKEVADLKQQLSGKEADIVSIKSQALVFKQKYEASRSKIPPTPLPPPINQADLAFSLKKLGLLDSLEVQIGVPTVISVTDAQVVFTLGEEAKRAKALDTTLNDCAQAVAASEAVVKAQGDGLELSSKALHELQAEADARQGQVDELARSLKVEKAKRWQKYGYAAAGIAFTLLVKK